MGDGFNFYALLFRLKYIGRWSLMKNLRTENVSEHCFETAIVAHTLSVIENSLFNGNVNEEKTALIALYHETAEVITGDLPTPIKYFNDEIKDAYKKIEDAAENKMLSALPDVLKERLLPSIKADKNTREYKLVKFADKITAFIKCAEEVAGGNQEFNAAKEHTFNELKKENDKTVNYFLDNFTGAFLSSLDEISK